MFWAFSFVGAFCEFGERVNNAFIDLNRVFDRLSYYLFPNEIQRILPTLLMAFQQPVLLRGFGNLIFERTTFKMVKQFLKIIKIPKHITC